jgi:hypothetical protein
LDEGKRRNGKRLNKFILGGMSTTSDPLGGRNPDQDLVLPFVRLYDIVAATRNFSEAYKIGQGGFGKVYMVAPSLFLLLFHSPF